jgi:anhydro-N-acetylmuramic acid kinase
LSNYLANQLGQEYDKNGENANKGYLNEDLLQKMNDFDYFSLPYPKSLGKEFFEDYFKPLLDSYSCSVEDKLHTFGMHFISQLSDVIGEGSLLITGGGAYNSFWVEGFKKQNPQCVIAPTNAQLINFKEALIFGFLGALRLQEEVNTLATVTGASKNSVGGAVYLAK